MFCAHLISIEKKICVFKHLEPRHILESACNELTQDNNIWLDFNLVISIFMNDKTNQALEQAL